MDSQIAQKTQELTKAEEMRNQTRLVMQPYANWEEYLTPAPLSIAILGELVFISSQKDFSINKNPPKGGYKYIKYPDSFRGCLLQVCNTGWWAFNEAHKNMGQIRLHTLAVPDFMKAAVKILFQGNDEVIKAHLPDQLDNIRVIADECLALAESTEKRFTDVIHVLEELMEACVNAEHFYGKELEEIKKKVEANKMREEAAKERSERMEKALKTLEKEVANAQEMYSKAMNSMPSGWDMIGMDFVAALTEGITCRMNGIAAAAAKEDNKSQEGSDSSADAIDEIKIYSTSAEILKHTEGILMYVKEADIDWKSLYDQQNKATKTDFYKEQFKRISDELKDIPKCKQKDLVLDLCKEGINICTEIAKYAPDGKCEKAKTEELIKKITELNGSARTFDSKSKDVTKSPCLAPKPPMMYKEESKSKSTRPSERATENARFRIKQSEAQLNKTKESYEKCVEKMENNQKELTEVLITMRNCEVQEIDFGTKIKILGQGLIAMGKAEEQWKKMVRFFQMVSSIVKTSLTSTLKNFVSTSEKTQSLSYNAKLFSKDLLYNQAFQATNIASLIHMISGTYTDISEKYLMDRVSSLGKLMTMDKGGQEFINERQKLQNSCDEAQKEILRLVLKNKAEFERKTDARLEKIDKELLAILPKASPEEEKRIQAAVDNGFTEEEHNDYA